MTSPTGTPGGPRRDGLVRALDGVRRTVREQAGELLATVPDTGDVATGRAVDQFVEQAADALLALDTTLAHTLRELEGMPAGGPSGTPGEPHHGAYRALPESWR